MPLRQMALFNRPMLAWAGSSKGKERAREAPEELYVEHEQACYTEAVYRPREMPEEDSYCQFCCEEAMDAQPPAYIESMAVRPSTAMRRTASSSSESSAVSSVSRASRDSMPGLSPSRPPLFDDESDEEDPLPVTPESSISFSPPRRVVRRSASASALPTVWKRKLSVSRPARADPLLKASAARSPSSSSPRAARVPSGTSAPATPTISFVQPTYRATTANSGVASASSLLTKSLQSSTRLPNLSPLSPPPSPPRPAEPSRLSIAPELFADKVSATFDDLTWERVDPIADSGFPLPSGQLSSAPVRDEQFKMRRRQPSDEHSDILPHFQDVAAAPEGAQAYVAPPSPHLATVDLPLPSPDEVMETAPLPADASAPQRPLTPLTTPNRVLSNSSHLLMLSLELKMMREGKITRPLRPRGIVIKRRESEPLLASLCSVTAQTQGECRMKAPRSALRWEVRQHDKAASRSLVSLRG